MKIFPKIKHKGNEVTPFLLVLMMVTNLAAVPVYDRYGEYIGDFPLVAGGDLKDANLAGASLWGGRNGMPVDLSEVDFSGANLSGAWIQDVNLSGCDFTNANLTDAVLRDVGVSGTKLANAKLTLVSSANLTGSPADMPTGWGMIDARLVGPGASLNSVDLSGQDLKGVSLRGTRAYGTIFSGADLTGVDLSEALLNEADFSDADCSGADFTGAGLANASLAGATYDGAIFKGCLLRHADLSGAILENADLAGVRGRRASGTPASLPDEWMVSSIGLIGPGCDLSGESISDWIPENGATLRDANLSGANILDCDLRRLDLSGANLSGAYLAAMVDGADFSNVMVADATLYMRNVYSRNDFDGLRSGGIMGTPDILEGLDLIGGWLIGPGVSLENADLSGLDLSEADLTGVRSGGLLGVPSSLPDGWLLRGGLLLGNGIDLTDMELASFDLRGLKATGTSGTPASLPAGWRIYDTWLLGPGADLSGGRFEDGLMAGFDLRGADLTGAYFNGADIAGTDFRGATLSGTRMWRVHGVGANFSGATIEQTAFDQARLKGADFSGAQMASVFFRSDLIYGADLREADFKNAVLDRVSFQGCELAGADFGGASWDYESGISYWDNATYTLETTLPDFLDPEQEGMTLEASMATLDLQIDALEVELAESRRLADSRAAEIIETREVFAELGRSQLPDRAIPYVENGDTTLVTEFAADPMDDIVYLFHCTAVGESGYAIDAARLDNQDFELLIVDDTGETNFVTLPSMSSAYSPSGRRMASLGEIVLVGEAQASAGGLSRAGKAFVVHRDASTGQWTVAESLQAAVPNSGAMFGHALSSNGTRVAISAPAGGPVEIFRLADGEITREALIEPPAILAGAAEGWGTDVLIHGDCLWIAAEYDSTVLGTHGSVALFRKSEDVWEFDCLLKTPVPSMASNSSRFGSRLAYGGGIIAIAEPGANAGHEGAGLLHLYRETNGEFQCFASVSHGDTALNGFGAQLAVTSDGRVLTSTTGGGLFRVLHDGARTRVVRIAMGDTPTRLEDPVYPFPSALCSLGNGDALAADTADIELDGNAQITSFTAGRIYRITSTDIDSDSDGLADADEQLLGTDALVADSNADGISDGAARDLGIDPSTDHADLKAFFSNRTDLLDGVYTATEIRDLRPGSTLFNVSDGKATLRMKLQQSENLQDWTDAVETSVEVPAEGPVKFFRFAPANP